MRKNSVRKYKLQLQQQQQLTMEENGLFGTGFLPSPPLKLKKNAEISNSGTLEVTKRLVAWRINNFDKSSICITSKEFMIGEWYWHIEFSPSALMTITMIQNNKYRSAQSLPVPVASVVFRMLYHISGSPHIIQAGTQAELTGADFLSGGGFSFGVGNDALHRGVPITFSCEFLDLKASLVNDGKSYTILNEEYPEQYSPLNRMLSKSIYTDVVITTMDGRIEAHRAVLAASSTVFETMFSNNYKEKETSTINITDMSIEACKAMVNFIYGKRTINEIRAHAMELTLAGDKYDIMDLKRVCEATLCEDVCAKNVFERLKSASMFGLGDLKSTCLFYLVKMGTIFELREDYNTFLREADRELIVDVSNALLGPWKQITGREVEVNSSVN